MSSYRPNLRSNSLPLPRSDEVSMRPSEENQRRKKGRSQTSLNAQTEILAHTQSSRALESQIERQCLKTFVLLRIAAEAVHST